MASQVLQQLENAVLAYLQANDGIVALDPQPNFYVSKRSGTREFPAVEIGAKNATEETVGTGNYWCDLTVTVKTSAEPVEGAEDASDAIADAVFAAMEGSDLPASLSAAIPDFTCFGIGEGNGQDSDTDEDAWADPIRKRVMCCARTLNP